MTLQHLPQATEVAQTLAEFVAEACGRFSVSEGSLALGIQAPTDTRSSLDRFNYP